MREVVDHYFPPVNTLVKSGGEEYTDFTYWRDPVLDLDDFSASDSGEPDDNASDDEDANEEMGDSYMSRDSIDDGEGDDYHGLEESILSGSVDEDEIEDEADNEADADAEEVDDDDNTQVIDPQALEHSPKRKRERDVDGEIVSGIPGLTREGQKH
jgi:phosphatidate phosphatase LPIN